MVLVNATSARRSAGSAASKPDFDALRLWAKHPSGHPEAPHGYLFPVDAVAIVGATVLGDAGWGGNEMRLSSIQFWPLPDIGAECFEAAAIEDTRKRYLGRFLVAAQMLRELGEDWSLSPDFTKAEWDAARAATADRAWEWGRAKSRLKFIVSHIGRRAEAGLLQTVYRPKGGGEQPKAIPQAWWSLDDFMPRFRSCAIDPGNPTRTSGSLPAWFFIEEAAIREIGQSLVNEIETPLTEAANVHLSPYIRLMIEASKRAEVGPSYEEQPLKKQLVHLLESLAPQYGLTPSGRDIDAMATFIREPGMKEGGPTAKARQRSAG